MRGRIIHQVELESERAPMDKRKIKRAKLTVREYARLQGVTMQTVYRRIWNRQVIAQQLYGRWLISVVTDGQGN